MLAWQQYKIFSTSSYWEQVRDAENAIYTALESGIAIEALHAMITAAAIALNTDQPRLGPLQHKRKPVSNTSQCLPPEDGASHVLTAASLERVTATDMPMPSPLRRAQTDRRSNPPQAVPTDLGTSSGEDEVPPQTGQPPSRASGSRLSLRIRLRTGCAASIDSAPMPCHSDGSLPVVRKRAVEQIAEVNGDSFNVVELPVDNRAPQNTQAPLLGKRRPGRPRKYLDDSQGVAAASTNSQPTSAARQQSRTAGFNGPVGTRKAVKELTQPDLAAQDAVEGTLTKEQICLGSPSLTVQMCGQTSQPGVPNTARASSTEAATGPYGKAGQEHLGDRGRASASGNGEVRDHMEAAGTAHLVVQAEQGHVARPGNDGRHSAFVGISDNPCSARKPSQQDSWLVSIERNRFADATPQKCGAVACDNIAEPITRTLEHDAPHDAWPVACTMSTNAAM